MVQIVSMHVLFVCTGNICRSPTAEGVFRHQAAAQGLKVTAASCGTHGYHIGAAPDPRSIHHARLRGYDLSALRASQLTPQHFAKGHLLLAMDRGHLSILTRLAPQGHGAELRLFLDTVTELKGQDVPDPYYDGPEAFDHALDLIERGVEALIADLLQKRR